MEAPPSRDELVSLRADFDSHQILALNHNTNVDYRLQAAGQTGMAVGRARQQERRAVRP